VDLVFGVDGGLARNLEEMGAHKGHDHGHDISHAHEKGHQSEVEVLSVMLHAEGVAVVDTMRLEKLLKSAPKDEIYRIKAVMTASSPIASSDDSFTEVSEGGRYILNWAFGRWTCTPMIKTTDAHESTSGIVLQMTIILARYESTKWKKRLECAGFIQLDGDQKGAMQVEQIA